VTYPSERGEWFGRLKGRGEWRWWTVYSDHDEPWILWATVPGSGIGYQLGFIEWDTSVGAYPLAA
jgi:hypothetical protein